MGESSPSRLGPPSSPTVAALQNRRVQANVRGMPYRSPVQPTLPMVERQTRNSLVDRPTAPQPPQAERPPVIRGIQLICTDELPDKIRSIFPHELLNAVQSKCFHTAFQTDDNLVLSAPTGSGKTLVMELAIARLLATGSNTDFKVVYMAPTKALCGPKDSRTGNASLGSLDSTVLNSLETPTISIYEKCSRPTSSSQHLRNGTA